MPDKKEALVAASLVTAAEKHLKVGNAQQSVQAATSASEIFRGLGTEGEGALPDVLRLVIDGKRMLAIQQQEDLAPVRQFAEDAKSNFAKAELQAASNLS
ncbi:NLRP1 [Symbiodinium sp. KB8]|nr:NLRP1 [Symbiodinium sp. KB8]